MNARDRVDVVDDVTVEVLRAPSTRDRVIDVLSELVDELDASGTGSRGSLTIERARALIAELRAEGR